MAARLPGQDHTKTVTKAGSHSDGPGTGPFHPQTRGKRGKPENKYRGLESRGDLGNRPSVVLGRWNSKNAPCLDCAISNFHYKARNRD